MRAGESGWSMSARSRSRGARRLRAARSGWRRRRCDAIVGGKLKKGEALAAARIAGIMAAKRTHEMIPLCHQIPLEVVEVDFNPDAANSVLQIQARAVTDARTGVEMEALVAVSAAALDDLRHGQGDRSRDGNRRDPAGREARRPQRRFHPRRRAAMAVAVSEPLSARDPQARQGRAGPRRQSVDFLAGNRPD